MFGIILTTDDKIQLQIEKLCQSLRNIQIDKNQYRIYISIGIYKIKKDDNNIIQALDKALIAHNLVKGNYDIEYKIFNEEMENEIIKEHNIESKMEKALQNNEFKIYYQPKISIQNEKIVAAEALVRWVNNGKIIPPNQFIPIFEKNHFIINLDKYIFEKVCQDISGWKRKNKNIPLISINISKENFVKDNFIKEYQEITEKYGLKSSEIELEITESAAINENIDIIKVMQNIKKAGFIISIDDFGTGYSSLNLLQSMPIDSIKIDKSFIDKIDIKNREGNIVDYIIFIAKKLKLKTTAEGVETEKQKEYLKNIGCDLIQGYFYSKPLNKEEFEKYVKHLK